MWPHELDALRPEARELGDDLAASFDLTPPLESTPVEESRQLRLSGGGAFPAPVFLDHAEERLVSDDDIPVRIFRPDTVHGVYLHIHGGGWTIGSRMSHDEMLDEIARATNQVVVSVGYPLAPENPYPAAPDVCEAAAVWLVNNAESEFGTTRLTIGGESAGAHLSLVTLLRLRDNHGLGAAFAGANLTYGCFDLSGTPSVHGWTERLVLSPENLEFFFDNFLQHRTPTERRDPDISPLYADLAGLPPLLLLCGTRDPLLDDSVLLANRLSLAGVEHELRFYPEGIHGFISFPHGLQTAAQNDINQWLRSRVQP